MSRITITGELAVTAAAVTFEVDKQAVRRADPRNAGRAGAARQALALVLRELVPGSDKARGRMMHCPSGEAFARLAEIAEQRRETDADFALAVQALVWAVIATARLKLLTEVADIDALAEARAISADPIRRVKDASAVTLVAIVEKLLALDEVARMAIDLLAAQAESVGTGDNRAEHLQDARVSLARDSLAEALGDAGYPERTEA